MVRLLAILLLLFSAATAHTQSTGTKYWFAAGGSDANSCPSISGTNDPGRYRTWEGTWACMHGGDTFHIKAGSYPYKLYEFTINIPNGYAGSPTTIEGEGATGCGLAGTCNTILTVDGSNIEDGQYITIRNLAINGNGAEGSCLRLNNSTETDTQIIIDNVEFHHCWNHGVFASSHTNHLTIRNFNFHHTNLQAADISGHGCYLAGDDTLLENFKIHDITLGTNIVGCQIYDSGFSGTVDRAIVRNGEIFNISTSDALVIAGANVQVYNMLLYSNLRGMSHYGGSSNGGCNTGLKFYNNTVYNNALAVYIGLFAGSGCTGLTADLSNNIIVGNRTNVDLQNGWTSSGTRNLSNATGSNNCVVLCGSAGVTVSAITDITMSISNFHLKSGTNSAVDAGVTLTTVTTDKDGIKRPQGSGSDIGAYERSGSGTTQLAAPANLRVS